MAKKKTSNADIWILWLILGAIVLYLFFWRALLDLLRDLLEDIRLSLGLIPLGGSQGDQGNQDERIFKAGITYTEVY